MFFTIPLLACGEAQPAISGGNAQPVTSGGNAQPVTSGGNAQPITSGGNAQAVTSGGNAQPVTSGGKSALTVEMTLEQIVAKADWIVTGSVLATDTKKDAASGNINTFVTVRVNEWLKGKTGQGDVVIKVPGGVIGSEKQWIEDVPGFSIGETVLVYLTANADGTWSMVGGPEGKVLISGGTSQDLVMPGSGSTESLISRIKSIVSQTVEK